MLKKLLALFAGAVLCLCVGVSPILSTAAQETAPLHGAADGKTLKIACVGASTTSGNNLPEDKGTSYPAYLKLLMGNNVEVRNFGYPGASVIKGRQWSYIDGWHSENYQRMYQDSLDYHADVVIIDLGGNDAGIFGIGTFAQDYEELVTSYLNQEQQPLVLLATGGYCTISDEGNRILADLIRPAQEAVGRKYGLPMADLVTFLQQDPEAYIGSDGIHYTAKGYKDEAQMFYDILSPLIEIPGGVSEGLMDPPELNIPIGEYDGVRCLMWEKGRTGGFSYTSGALAFALGVEEQTLVDVSITVSYYWDHKAGGNDWWWFNTTDKTGQSAPGINNGNPHDNGFGTFSAYGMRPGAWNELTVSRTEQLLGGGGADWMVYVGSMDPANSLYINGFRIHATLADGTVKEANWGIYVLPAGDKTALTEAVEREIDFSLYTEESVAVYTAALNAAKAVLDDASAMQEEIDAALNDLLHAWEMMQPVGPIAIPGDVDGDGKITSTDARLTLQYYANKITEEDLDLSVADVDGDSKVTSTDARLILQLYAGKIENFPAEG